MRQIKAGKFDSVLRLRILCGALGVVLCAAGPARAQDHLSVDPGGDVSASKKLILPGADRLAFGDTNLAQTINGLSQKADSKLPAAGGTINGNVTVNNTLTFPETAPQPAIRLLSETIGAQNNNFYFRSASQHSPGLLSAIFGGLEWYFGDFPVGTWHAKRMSVDSRAGLSINGGQNAKFLSLSNISKSAKGPATWYIYPDHQQMTVPGRNQAVWVDYTNLVFEYVGTGRKFSIHPDGQTSSESDVRLKKDIIPLGSVLERVNQLRPVPFHYKTCGEDVPRTLGFIAQDVEPLFPPIVDESEGTKGLVYTEFIPVAIGGIQELSAHQTAIKDELKREDACIESLDRDVAGLRRMIAGLALKQGN